MMRNFQFKAEAPFGPYIFFLCVAVCEIAAFRSGCDLQARGLGVLCGCICEFGSVFIRTAFQQIQILFQHIRTSFKLNNTSIDIKSSKFKNTEFADEKIGAPGASILAGYMVGLGLDAIYACVFGNDFYLMYGFIGFLLSLFLFLFRLNKKIDTASLFLTLLASVWMAEYCTPNFILEKRSPEEGIYIYENDVVYDYPILNIYTSRLGGFSHTGLCLLTKDPFSLNQQRRTAGLKTLRFEKLEGGYWMNDLNLDISDQDGFTNYGSGTSLSEIAYPFDVEHWKNFLNGHSENDRLNPSVRVLHLAVSDPCKKWNQIIEFRDSINAQFPEGFIYSPIPFQGRRARLYNCNSLTVGISDEFLQSGEKAERLTAGWWNIGSQNVEQGRALMKDYRSKTFKAEIEAERIEIHGEKDGVKDGTKNETKDGEKHWIHRMLFRPQKKTSRTDGKT